MFISLISRNLRSGYSWSWVVTPSPGSLFLLPQVGGAVAPRGSGGGYRCSWVLLLRLHRYRCYHTWCPSRINGNVMIMQWWCRRWKYAMWLLWSLWVLGELLTPTGLSFFTRHDALRRRPFRLWQQNFQMKHVLSFISICRKTHDSAISSQQNRILKCQIFWRRDYQ